MNKVDGERQEIVVESPKTHHLDEPQVKTYSQAVKEAKKVRRYVRRGKIQKRSRQD